MLITTTEKTPELALAGISDFFSSLAENSDTITGITSVVGGFSSLYSPKPDATSDVAKTITEVKTAEAATSFDWSNFLGVVDKAVSIGTGLWGGSPTQDIQVAQLELAKANANTEAERAKAAALIAQTRQAALSAQTPSQAVMSKTVMGVSGLALLALGGGALLMFSMRRK